MQFEPSWSLNVIAVVGLSALYVWYLLAHSTILDKPMGGARCRFPLLIGCPFCAGFWIVGLILVATQTYDPLTHLATAGLVGLLGRYTV
jgi:hypothetical protein